MKNKLTVYKSNKVIEASYKLTLNEQKLILLCIAKSNPTKPLLPTDVFEVTATEFAKSLDIALDGAYQALKESSDHLFERYIIIDNPDPDIPALKYTRTRWVSSIDYLPDMGKVVVCFAQKMIPYLSELKHQFTKYDLKNVSGMSSAYGVRLYELLMQWISIGKREVSIEWLKQQFEISSEYDRIFDFKKYVLEPAINDINNKSNLTVEWTQRKTGRNVTHLTFKFAEKKVAKKTKNKKTQSEKPVTKLDDITHYAELRKKFGDALPADAIPVDIAEKLKSQGKW
jgi:plasmid replication initiation protein